MEAANDKEQTSFYMVQIVLVSFMTVNINAFKAQLKTHYFKVAFN